VDEKRVANIPNITEKPAKVKFFARGSEDNSAFHIRNIRIAKGAVPLYDKLLTDGKIITHGITFDVGKATIKPQSMGTINEIFCILQKYPDLRFSVEGHTDNTGNAANNQTLSEARAKAVCDKLQQMGYCSKHV
jgi:outer membrane protein OmpA-like peptidoglycan-associated protein